MAGSASSSRAAPTSLTSTTSPTSTATSPTPTPSHRLPIGAIVGGVVGGLALLLLFLLLFFLRRRRLNRQRRWRDPALVIEPKSPSEAAAPSALPWSGAGGANASCGSFNPYTPPAPGPASFASAYHDRSGSALHLSSERGDRSSVALLPMGASAAHLADTPSRYPSSSWETSRGAGTALLRPEASVSSGSAYSATAAVTPAARSPLAVANPGERPPSAAAAAPPPAPAHKAVGKVTSDMQSQIDALKTEVERLRANHQDVDGMAPPAYEPGEAH